MHRLKASLCFKKTQMKRVGVMLGQHFAKQWGFDEDTVLSFANVFAVRARNMMHIVGSADRKNNKAPWVQRLPWRAKLGGGSNSAAPTRRR